jgi:hypothetical protein
MALSAVQGKSETTSLVPVTKKNEKAVEQTSRVRDVVFRSVLAQVNIEALRTNASLIASYVGQGGFVDEVISNGLSTKLLDLTFREGVGAFLSLRAVEKPADGRVTTADFQAGEVVLGAVRGDRFSLATATRMTVKDHPMVIITEFSVVPKDLHFEVMAIERSLTFCYREQSWVLAKQKRGCMRDYEVTDITLMRYAQMTGGYQWHESGSRTEAWINIFELNGWTNHTFIPYAGNAFGIPYQGNEYRYEGYSLDHRAAKYVRVIGWYD